MTPRLPLEEVARRCAEETQKYSRHAPSEPQFCFELLRRALADAEADAFTWVYRIYERQVLRWVYQHRSFQQTGETAEFFANSAFDRFYFALRGPKFEKFDSLPKLLTYLKACVYTAVAQYRRDHQQLALLALDDARETPASTDPGLHLEAAEVWAYICHLLPDERDQRLAHCAFVLGLKPREVLAAYPRTWQHEREISVALYRIRRRLRGDAGLRQLLEAPAEDITERES